MDKQRDMQVDLVTHWPASVPTKGFEWVEGEEVRPIRLRDGPSDYRLPDQFLLARGSSYRTSDRPGELYVDFVNLSPQKDQKNRIIEFANKHGSLRLVGRHFHRLDSGEAALGERWNEWREEILCFRTTHDLLYDIRDKNKAKIERFIKPLREHQPLESVDFLQPPCGASPWPDNPLEFAHEMVIQTIRHKLAGGLRSQPPCAYHGCTFQPDSDFSSQTRADVLATGLGAFELTVASTDLLKTVWLQLGAGNRRLKKCEAQDCGQYLDVTGFDRPGAHKMHRNCEERLRKQSLRKRQRRARELSAEGKDPAKIAKLLQADVQVVKGWISK